MAQTNPLPQKLKYLDAFRKEFASRSSEELDESAFSPLLDILAKRIAGLSDANAESLLAEDGEALGSWLVEPTHSDDCLRYVEVVFNLDSPAVLVRMIKEQVKMRQRPLLWIEMELWPGAKPRRFEKQGDGGMLVKWKGLLLAIGDMVDPSIKRGGRPTVLNHPDIQVSTTKVRFGEVEGTKYLAKFEDRMGRPDKRIIYVLSVPGGQAYADICFVGKQTGADWDETPIESFFHTLRVVLKQPGE